MVSLKEQKEAFVTGHEGTSTGELLLICLSVPLGIWLYQLIHPKSKVGACILEAFVLLYPMAICQTSFLYPWGISLLILGFSSGLIAAVVSRRSREQFIEEIDEPIDKASAKIAFVSSYRAALMYLTFVSILAVDFHVFPRRFAKTEVFGYGLMDLGAGSFVVAAGLVSSRARGVRLTKQGAAYRLIPLLALGFIRLLTTKGLEYQEHFSEYGVHWNFFFTLAMLSPLSTMIPSSLEISVGILVVYQFLLSYQGLQHYIETAPRVCIDSGNPLCNFLAANREGIFGVIGYLVLYLSAEHLGMITIWNQLGRRKERLVITSIVLWILHQVMVAQGIPASRRSTNATFCLWTLAHNFTIISMLCIVSVKNKVPPIFSAVNKNGLIVFIFANLLTGLVNLSMDTMAATDQMAILVLFVYLTAVGSFSLTLDFVMSNYYKAKRH